MLLGNKKKQGEEQNWSIVLSHLPNEIDKKRISRRISEIFSLSKEEASDLVCNTPIILLDNLTHTDASKIREFFRSEGADVIMTNDIFFKRKCYRTVWPEPPNLQFLHGEKPSLPAVKEQALRPEEALKELRSLRPSAAKVPEAQPQGPASSAAGEKEKGKIIRELEAWRKESFSRKDEMDKLKQTLDNTRDTLSSLEKEKKNQELSSHGRDKQISELRAQLSSAAEKYEALREEYKKSRMLYEERLSAARAEKEGVQAHLRLTEDKLRSIEDVNRGLRTSVERNNIKQDSSGSTEDYAALQGKAQALENEVKALREARAAENSRYEEQRRTLQKELEAEQAKVRSPQAAAPEKAELEKKLQDAARQIEALNKIRLELESRSQARLAENAASFNQRISGLETEKERLSADLQKYLSEAQAFKEKAASNDVLRAEIDALKAEKERLSAQSGDKEKQFQGMIEQAEHEKLELLKQEKEKRDLLELKLKASSDEAEHLRAGLEELRAEVSRLEKSKAELAAAFENSIAAEAEIKSKYESLGQKYNTLISQYDRDKLELLKTQDLSRELESSKGLLKKEAEELRTAKSQLESRLNSADAKLQELDRRNSFNETLKVQLSAELDQVKGFLKQKTEDADAAAELLEQTRFQLEQAQGEAKTFSVRVSEAEERLRHETLKRDSEAQQKDASFAELNLRYDEAVSKLKEAQETVEREREAAAKAGHLLEQRERDLEGVKKQLRDINHLMEQREALLKRNQIVAELAEKENQLKRMIEDQSRIENEIKEREEMMRLILRRQEEIEKEIISGKQAQRHLLEQVKKERPGAARFSKYEKKETDEA